MASNLHTQYELMYGGLLLPLSFEGRPSTLQ